MAATIFFFIMVIISGALTLPTYEDLTLVLSSFLILIMSWLYTKDKRTSKAEKKNEKDKK